VSSLAHALQVLLVTLQQVSPITIGPQMVLVVLVVLVAESGPDSVTVLVVAVVILGVQVMMVVMVYLELIVMQKMELMVVTVGLEPVIRTPLINAHRVDQRVVVIKVVLVVVTVVVVLVVRLYPVLRLSSTSMGGRNKFHPYDQEMINIISIYTK
tara:strand:- start:520 stop:984 length:465 start_codon:yes stop_codon:yes gene_type:complete